MQRNAKNAALEDAGKSGEKIDLSAGVGEQRLFDGCESEKATRSRFQILPARCGFVRRAKRKIPKLL